MAGFEVITYGRIWVIAEASAFAYFSLSRTGVLKSLHGELCTYVIPQRVVPRRVLHFLASNENNPGLYLPIWSVGDRVLSPASIRSDSPQQDDFAIGHSASPLQKP